MRILFIVVVVIVMQAVYHFLGIVGLIGGMSSLIADIWWDAQEAKSK